MSENLRDAPETRPPKRVIAYVDGFNLYFGILRNSPELKWLDIQSLVEFLRPNEDVVHVRYFTALVDPDLHVSTTRDRQKRYIKALCSCAKVEVIPNKVDLGSGRTVERPKEWK
jgi:hypothetical protein